MGELLVIDRETVRRLLPFETCIPLMREAMTALSAGRTVSRSMTSSSPIQAPQTSRA